MTDSYIKLPPQNTEVEKWTLGALLLEPAAYDTVAGILSPVKFYDNRHHWIYSAIEILRRNAEPVDMLTVPDQLKKMKRLKDAGGYTYIAELTQKPQSAAHIQKWAAIIAERWMMREYIRISSDLTIAAYDETSSPSQIVSIAQRALDSVSDAIDSGSFKDTTQLFKEADEYIEEIKKAADKGEVIGVPTTIAGINDAIGGWRKQNKITIASRPGMGKSALLKAIIKGACIENIPVALFSLEMSNVENIIRIISESDEVKLSSHQLLTGKYDKIVNSNPAAKVYYNDAGEPLLFIDDTTRIHSDIRRKAAQMVRRHGIGLIIIDYLNLEYEEGHKNDYAMVSAITRGNKVIAKENDVPVIEVAQLSRAVEKEGDKKPRLHHLRESGAIEESSDVIIFLYRPDYYGMEDPFGQKDSGYTDLIIAKSKNGPLNTIPLFFDKPITKFSDWSNKPK